MDEVTILDLVKIIPRPLPMEKTAENLKGDSETLGGLLNVYQDTLKENLGIPVSKLLQGTQRTP